jgi:hypothetical protein
MPKPSAITYKGITDSISGWARRTGIKKSRLCLRIKNGLALDDVFNPDKLSASKGTAKSTDGYYVNGQCKKIHRIKAESVLGRNLADDEHVHHIDGNKLNNENRNLLICKHEYHSLLHQRMRAMDACGNPEWRKCKFCGEYDDTTNLYIHPTRTEASHLSCRRKYEATKRINK